MAAPFATTAGVPATIARRSGVPGKSRGDFVGWFCGVAITRRAAARAVQAGKHTSFPGQ